MIIVQQRPYHSKLEDFIVSADHRIKSKETGKRNKYPELAREIKMTIEHEDVRDTKSNCCAWNNPQRIGKGTGKLGIKRTGRDHPNYSIIKIAQNLRKVVQI